MSIAQDSPKQILENISATLFEKPAEQILFCILFEETYFEKE